nr:putative exostosin-like protein [Tanacetum cinerariifolium]
TVSDSHETLLETEVSRMKMSQKPEHVTPVDYTKMNALQSSDPPKPVTPFVHTRPVNSEAAITSELLGFGKASEKLLKLYLPFIAFDTFGFLAPKTEKFLNMVQRVVQSNCSTPKTQNFIFSRIGFAIQKGVAAQLVARLPAILL